MIKIHGVIGSYKNEKGVEVKGLELADVISQVEAAGAVGELTFEINSIGGVVSVGYAIADYMESLKKAGKVINTVANGIVASIATIPFLAGTKREIVKGTDFLIHNPYASVQGDADALDQYAKELASEEKNMAKRYAAATGISEVTMDLLMREDKAMTPERAVELKFATAVIDGTLNSQFKNMQVIACLKSETMDTAKFIAEGKTLLETLKALAAKLTGGTKSLAVTTDDGKALNVEGEALAVGAVVTLDGQPTPSASYTLADGTKITTDADSKIAEITEPAPVEAKLGDVVKDEKGDPIVSGESVLANGDKVKTNEKGEIIELTKVAKATLTDAEKENIALKKVIEEMGKTQTAIQEQMAIMAKATGSSYTPPARTTVFGKRHEEAQAESVADDVRARREERKKAKQ